MKEAKYKAGDKLKFVNPISNTESIVILISRDDKSPSQRVAWRCKSYPDGQGSGVVPEDELFHI